MNEQTKPAQSPWRAEGSVLRDANGNSIASGGNNRVVVGAALSASLKLAAAAPDLLIELHEAQAAASEACAQLFDLAERGDATYAVRDAKQAVLHLQASQHRLRAAIAKATA